MVETFLKQVLIEELDITVLKGGIEASGLCVKALDDLDARTMKVIRE